MAMMGNMPPKKSAPKRKGNQKTLRERRDVDIMNTNDSSIVSKRSVSKLYLTNEPDFYEPFVPKFVRRNPLINRGYWLRMHAIEQAVRRFLELENDKQKIVINLGSGYDPLPFQFWHRYASLAESATFVDVDYPQLMERKRDRMLSNSLLRDALLKTKLRTSEQPVYLRSDGYMALGCDLKDLVTLERVLRAEFDIPAASVLFVAEVSVTYMPLKDSDTLIQWASTLEDARFCILEQYLPQGPEHPFAKTMLSHFDKLQASIKAVKLHSSLAQQASRFRNAGWPTLIMARNLWDLWSDDSFTPPTIRRGLDAFEPFDEWEEFALFGGHYFLLVASNAEQGTSTEKLCDETAIKECSKATDAESITLQSWKQPTGEALTARRFTAAFALDRDSVAIHGGQGTQARLADMDVLKRQDDIEDRTTQPSSQLPTARMCHTITSMSNGEALLVGGRGSPTQACADSCWLFKDRTWTRVDGLVPARYRHSAVAVMLGCGDTQEHGVLVFGGKASDGTVLDADDCCALWTANNGWHSIPVDGARPSARFGAAMSTIDSAQNRGLLTGGGNQSGVVVEDAVWEWSISAPTPRLRFNDRTNDVRSNLENSAYARIGSSLVPWGKSLMMIGGVSKKHIHSLSDDFLLLTCSDTTIEVEQPSMHVLPPTTWPLLVGVGAVSTSAGEIVLTGGGAVCFSMGSYWNEDPLILTAGSKQGSKPWRRVVPSHSSGTAGTVQAKVAGAAPQTRRKQVCAKRKPDISARTTEITRVQLKSSDDFASLVAASKPVIIEGLDIGPCTDLWTLDYLKEKLGPQRELVIHECPSDRMTFKDKNFAYVKKSVADFLDGIAQGSHAYLRAVSSSQPNKLPTKLEDDFPNIASDFRLPDVCSVVKENYHSSPLRISGPVSLWLHYDVLSNVLCQIRGNKTLYLYPPSDVSYLDYPPGGSSSNTDVLTSKHPKLRNTHPHVASLKPGDILFIPPMWSHTATPEDGVSVAVNVFWKGLDKGYAAGKDVYGNRDLQAYENGRRDVEKIVRAFKDIPVDVSRFYLERLAGEILERAKKMGEKKI
ncbi:O-Methyltransferase polyketide biosynthesis [Pyrenophora tritici-repentis]|uniref:tRNA wybutosine-synthesizing protein 4 n=1 Tax=Pyrenophora tritici-repentis TaxID=45151 RepID=A0A2W1IAQ5_9PLEO|nr:Leucine carboxyl methyltransferase 2 [Pyrenophora tritici-repentis]KAF7579153.1 O-Methyltransferase involved in polyketide biosynthesis [Pyrenophora tritici-repentis]KAI0587521.1 Leucine carboxyl methyltransferase 2 [Pyrenophora tritici-repentis]KAI0611432.1 Leucine carboxyl methyltransferase 2 [Pyrenophora tritici-repentis]KAI1513023.1 Leucine carboxyl methyltransferase [Pyrenophora tritici-repentis]